jgi:hypothetical protein
MNVTIEQESPYAIAGPQFIARGYSAIPIMPGEKRPDPSLGTEWERFCDRLPTELEIDVWSKRAFGVGVALGRASGGLTAIDIDSDNLDVTEAIESRWPSTVRKAGRKGYTAFYWASQAVKSRAFKFGNGDGVDLLCHGRQTVLPPTIHPTTGKPYIWTTVDTLEHVSVDNLPKLPDDIVARLADALQLFGYEAPPERLDRGSHGGGSGEWSDVNATALAHPAEWAPEIGAQKDGSSWRLQASWRNGDGRNVSIHATGIKDFVYDVGYSPIDLVAAVRDLSPGDAKDWLEERLGMKPEPINCTFSKKSKSIPNGYTEGEAVEDNTAEKVTDSPARPIIPPPMSMSDPSGDIARKRMALHMALKPPEGEAFRKLNLVNGNQLLVSETPPPWFLVDGVIQARKVFVLMGSDGLGKSFMLLTLAVSTVLGLDWLGFKVRQGPVIFFTAEEEARDVQYRLKAIGNALGIGRNADLSDLHLITVEGAAGSDGDTTFGGPDSKGQIQMTPLWRTLVRAVAHIKPVGLFLDPLVEIFDGNEIIRTQARQFLSPMRNLARNHDLSVVLAGHPSESGKRSRTGSSGSTGWKAASRGFGHLEPEFDGDGPDAKPIISDKRTFTIFKVTGGGHEGKVINLVKNKNGVLLLAGAEQIGDGSLLGIVNAVLADDRAAETEFLAHLDTFTRNKIRVTNADSRNGPYAPKKFAEAASQTGRAPRAAIKRLADAMTRLIERGVVEPIEFGPQSRLQTKLMRASIKQNEDEEDE